MLRRFFWCLMRVFFFCLGGLGSAEAFLADFIIRLAMLSALRPFFPFRFSLLGTSRLPSCKLFAGADAHAGLESCLVGENCPLFSSSWGLFVFTGHVAFSPPFSPSPLPVRSFFIANGSVSRRNPWSARSLCDASDTSDLFFNPALPAFPSTTPTLPPSPPFRIRSTPIPPQMADCSHFLAGGEA